MGERLRGIDAAFLAIETPSNHLHMAMLALLDPSTAPGGWSFGALRALVTSRLHLAPLFRRRIVEVPYGLHHPVWYDDPDFVLDNHLRRLAVAPPGGEAELLDAVGAALAVPLDRSRPRWELHVAEGLADGRAAVLAKSHHAANDGMSGTEVLLRLLDLQAAGSTTTSPPDTWCPSPLPDDAELVSEALAALAARPAEAAAAARSAVDLVSRLWRHRRGTSGALPPKPFSAPRTALNVGLTGPERQVAVASLSLDDVREVKAHFGVTVNDVVLAVCSGALRSWFATRGEESGGDLVALVPASVRTEADAASPGNRVSPMLVSLASATEDPVERLRSIATSARAAKAQQREVGSAALADWAEVAPPALVAGVAQVASALHLADVLPPVFNVSVSNLAGPPMPLYLAGARVVAAHPLGPVADGGALNITVLSYDATLWFGLVADRGSVEGLPSLAAGLTDSFEELRKAALR
ncbi:MAG: wax ester/triacylglycerol synthase family O-acyltransferase [Acidimicrobiales bacterium]